MPRQAISQLPSCSARWSESSARSERAKRRTPATSQACVIAYKQPLHGLVEKLGWYDVYAGVRLLIATFIALPLLPNEAIDPWGALNPYKLWLLVILISSLSLVGYVLTRWLGPRGARR